MSEAAANDAREEFSLVFTKAGSFKVAGTVQETLSRIADDEWPSFLLADGEEQQVVIRSADVVAIQRLRGFRGSLGFRP